MIEYPEAEDTSDFTNQESKGKGGNYFCRNINKTNKQG